MERTGGVSMPEEDLKQVLFEHTKKFYERYQEFKKLFGENNETTIKCKNKYYGCHLVVVRSGLEDEYESWLKQQQGSETCA